MSDYKFYRGDKVREIAAPENTGMVIGKDEKGYFLVEYDQRTRMLGTIKKWMTESALELMKPSMLNTSW